MEERLKAIETELAYLRKTLEEFIKTRPIELHEHYHNDYRNMKPMIINNPEQLKGLFDEIEE